MWISVMTPKSIKRKREKKEADDSVLTVEMNHRKPRKKIEWIENIGKFFGRFFYQKAANDLYLMYYEW